MLKRGSAGDNVLTWYAAYIIIGVFFFGIVFYCTWTHAGGVALWEDFYAKEIVRIINSASADDEIYLDVTPATSIAFDRGLVPNEIVTFDNERHAVTVRLTPSGGTTFSYFNSVSVAPGYLIELPSGSATTNRLHFVVAGQEEAE